jgi:phage shock protein PspC (stress-responsive transcriptional regulator)
MQKVITINLNGNAYQLDETGYEALRAYLAGAERELAGNPDRAEIMVDLEQAIADKCQKFLGPHKSVVTATEVEQIVKEMGPIETARTADAGATTEGGGPRKGADHSEPPPKRLFRNPDGAMIAGVCNGLAAYFGIDVTLMRIAFVIAAILSKGAAIVVYVAMMFIVPEARTAEERAVAGGLPFNAKEVIDRAKRQATQGTRQWQRAWRRQQRHWRRFGWTPGASFAYGQPPWAAPLVPLFALVHLALFVAMAAMMISLVNTGRVLDWSLPPDVPLWAGVLILLVAYQIVVSPIRAVQHWSWNWRADGQPAPYAFWSAVVWLIGMAFVLWMASNHIPEIREFVHRLPPLVQQFASAMRDLFSR